jgi:hypothetical protein
MVARSFVPRLEPNEGDITAQQVRDIRAHLRRMSEAKISSETSKQGGEVTLQSGDDKRDSKLSSKRGSRIDTEHRGVTGTLVLTDVLDEKVIIH